MRTAEDLSQEVLSLREANNRMDNLLRESRAETKAARVELDWWRKTFGPEKWSK